VTGDQFQQIKKLNNAAYGSRDAADMEKLLRKPIQSTDLSPDAMEGSLEGAKTSTGLLAQEVDSLSADGTITPDRVSAYAQEMQQMAQHRSDMLAEIKAKGDYLVQDSSARANWFKNMALEQKYISRVETLTDALRLQNGLDPIDRGGKSIALRGSSRAAENFATTGAAGAVADNSLSRANLELATSIAEVAKTNPEFAASGPSTIAQMAQNLSAADKGFLLDQIKQSAGNDFAASTATAMRGTPNPDPSFKGNYQTAVEEGKRQAASEGGTAAGDSTFAEWDKAMADSIGIDNDLSKISNVSRVQMNQLGQKWLPRMNNALGAYFAAKELYGAGQDMGQYLDFMSAAMDSNTPDAVAQQYLENAQQIAQGMIAKGTWGAVMAGLFEAFPTVGAIVGTFAISYNGTRWVLETTGADKVVTIDLAVSGIDAGNQLSEAAANGADWFWNGSTRAQRETQLMLDSYQRALDRGDIILRDGVTQQDLSDAIKSGDLGRVHNALVQNNPCGLAKSQVNLTGNATASATTGTTAADKVYVYALKGIGLVIATEKDVTTTHACIWNGGGPRPCPDGKPAEILGKAGKGDGYASAADAHADLKTSLTCTNGYWGLKADVFGGQWLQNNVTSADCKSIK
jgi:hypothetical protein